MSMNLVWSEICRGATTAKLPWCSEPAPTGAGQCPRTVLSRFARYCLVMTWLATFVSVSAHAQTHEWTHQFGTSETDYGYGISSDGLGNVYVTGQTSVSLGAGNGFEQDTVLAKYDTSGVEQWTRYVDVGGSDRGYAVSADGNGNIYVSGRNSDDALLSQFNNVGELQWTRAFNSGRDSYGYGVSTDPFGNIYLAGYTLFETPLGNGAFSQDYDAFLTKYSAAGAEQWTEWIGNPNDDEDGFDDRHYAVAADELGNVYVTGRARLYSEGQGQSDYDAYLAKYDAAGELAWFREFGTFETEFSRAVSVDGQGNVYVAGYTGGDMYGTRLGGNDAFLAKFEANGVNQWFRQFGSAESDIAYGLSADDAGNVYVAGRTRGGMEGPNAAVPNGSTQNDAFLVQYNANGDHLWTRQFGTTDNDTARAVALDQRGDVYVAGQTRSNLGGEYQGGFGDIFVAKFNQELIGDFNDDRKVNGKDLLRWQHDPTVGEIGQWQEHFGDTETGRPPVDAPPPPLAEPDVRTWAIQATVVEVIDPSNYFPDVQLGDHVTGLLSYDVNAQPDLTGETFARYSQAYDFHVAGMIIENPNGEDLVFPALPFVPFEAVIGLTNDDFDPEIPELGEIDSLAAIQPMEPVYVPDALDALLMVNLIAQETLDDTSIPTVLDLQDWPIATIAALYLSEAGDFGIVAEINSLTPGAASSAILPGDLDRDDTVGGKDLLLGQLVHTIDGLAPWQSHFGLSDVRNAIESASHRVPEPTSIFLAAVVLLHCCTCWR